MAKFTITYLPDGTIEKKLYFLGKDYICRQSPFIHGVSRTLDDGISEQLEKKGKYAAEILDLAYDAFDDMADDLQDAIVRLTIEEKRYV